MQYKDVEDGSQCYTCQLNGYLYVPGANVWPAHGDRTQPMLMSPPLTQDHYAYEKADGAFRSHLTDDLQLQQYAVPGQQNTNDRDNIGKKKSTQKYSDEDNEYLVQLRDQGLSWKEIRERYEERAQGRHTEQALQMRWCRYKKNCLVNQTATAKQKEASLAT
ncbi:hypothetical protein Dda_7085 [Drechslerella dactyloides]|uniref:Myb-like domain-containing protein n=1 Tax=Drechslerella dactyloides TaxID=74499 RepID=A0AAD6IT38_DREDA|nr:hypothetical protein Dda_7085 [Drechslerella dactyloides]